MRKAYDIMVAKSCVTLFWSFLISKKNNLFIFCIDITSKSVMKIKELLLFTFRLLVA